MARLYSTAAPRSCGRHWTLIFRRRRSSLIRTFRWMKSSTILRFLFQDCGRSMFSVRATPERQRYSFAISCWTRIILFITGYCTSAALLKNRKKWTLTLEKVNIENKKVNIEEDFTAKTASHVRKLQEDLGKEIVFGRSDVQRVLDLKPTRCTALLREMAEHGIIEPVTGYGKGKYRFRQQ